MSIKNNILHKLLVLPSLLAAFTPIFFLYRLERQQPQELGRIYERLREQRMLEALQHLNRQNPP